MAFKLNYINFKKGKIKHRQRAVKNQGNYLDRRLSNTYFYLKCTENRDTAFTIERRDLSSLHNNASLA